MTEVIIRRRLLATTMIAGMALAAHPAIAQTAAAPAPSITSNAANAAPADADTQEIVVTGSRITNPNLQAQSPVTIVTAKELKLTGSSRVEDILNSLPQSFSSQASGSANGADGTATANLRNLGDTRTLVLIDGKRLPPGDPSRIPGDNLGSAADLNMVPAIMLKRVDVLTGGASAAYGADAVAGVVNFIMDNDFEGFKVDATGAIYQHNNNNSIARSIITADPRYGSATNPLNLPSGNTVDGGTYDVSAAFGSKFGDDRGHISVFGSYHHQASVLLSSRDYDACPIDSNTLDGNGPISSKKADFYCGGSSNTAATSILPNGGTGSRVIADPSSPDAFRAFDFNTDAYNYNSTVAAQRPDSRYNAGAFVNYDLDDHFKPYGSFLFMDDHSKAQIAPSGTFNNVFVINCNNPLISAGELTQLGCAPGTASVKAALAKRNVEGGPRIDDLRHTDYRFVAGAKGDIVSGWSYDAYAQYGVVDYSENYQNDLSKSRVQSAINNCQNADGTAVSDSACVPYNIWTGTTTLQGSTAQGVTQSAIDYVSTPGFKSGQNREWVVSAAIQGDLGTYGIQSPLADRGVNIAFGPEYRKESFALNTDAEYTTGDLLGQGAEVKSVHGAFNVKEVFAEVNVPLVSDKPGFQDLSFDGAYRYSDYSSVGHTNTYKLSLEWAPFSGDLDGVIRFRGSYNQAVRAPTNIDLYSPRQLGLDGTSDPCATNPDNTDTISVACAATAASDPAFQHHSNQGVASNPAHQYNGVTAGAITAGSSLKPETAITKTLGVVIAPRNVLHGFTATVDYYDINLKNRIGTDGFDTIMSQCMASANVNGYYCSLIHRDPSNGSLWLGSNGYIVNPVYNAGHLKTSGIDVSANYDFDVSRFGSVSLGFNGTYLLKEKTEVTLHNDDGSLSSGGYYSCKGYYGANCGDPSPVWRHKLRVTYSPTKTFSLSGNWRFFGPTYAEAASMDAAQSNSNGLGKAGNRSTRISPVSFFDMTATFETSEHLELRLGVDNLLDRDPPLMPQDEVGVGSGGSFPNYYDALGRYIFAGVTAKF